jgi:hypothetical protein
MCGNNMLLLIAYQNVSAKVSKRYAFGENGPKRRLKNANSADCILFQDGLCVEIICFFRLRIKTADQKDQSDMLLTKTAQNAD